MNEYMRCPADVPSTKVNEFLKSYRIDYEHHLADVRHKVEAALREHNLTGRVYRIYSRADRGGGLELKHPLKVRLKFSAYCRKHHLAESSLFDMPDIVGMTVVTNFPSDISAVAAALDQLIERREYSVYRDARDTTPPVETSLTTLFGRAVERDGYQAVHYLLRRPGFDDTPICEVQIKTVLHDAWGVKTHDRSYKPEGRTDSDILQAFTLLGDQLILIDQQSDILRQRMERQAAVRREKSGPVRMNAICGPAMTQIERLADPARTELRAVFDSIKEMRCLTVEQIEQATFRIRQHMTTATAAATLLLGFLAAKSRRQVDLDNALDQIQQWRERTADPLEGLWACANAAVIAFACDSALAAIDLGDAALTALEAIDSGSLDSSNRQRLARMTNALYSSLAYYHAEAVGSYDGALSGSVERARAAMEQAATCRRAMGLLAPSLFESKATIRKALADPANAKRAYNSLDNEAFTHIQIAGTLEELMRARERLETIHEHKPAAIAAEADAAYAYHDYCAALRRVELEHAGLDDC